VSYAYLGVETVPIYPQLRERFDLPVGKGAWVQDVVADGPAADAGVKGGSDREAVFQVRSYRDGGDVITSIDGRPVDDPDDLSRAVALLDPGATVTLEAWRGGDRRKVRIELGDRPLSALPDAG